MPIPSTFKSPACLTGFGFTGAGGIGVAGWQIVEETYPSGDRIMRDRGWHWHPPTSNPELGSDASKVSTFAEGTISRFEFPTYDCFKKFFSEHEMKWTDVGGKAENDSFNLDEAKKNIESDKWPVGCAAVDFSYESADKLILKSEFTVKNDKFGWALWTGLKKIPKGVGHGEGDNSLSYYLTFLKKQATNWDVLGGYLWFDARFSQDSTSHYLKIIVPGDASNWIDAITKESSNPKRKSYFGIWTSYGISTGKEVLEELHIHSSDSSGPRAEILGKEGPDVKWERATDTNEVWGFVDSVTSAYVKDQGWKKITPNKDLTDTLNFLYSPFKGKKGKWFKPEDYCRKMSSTRGLPENELDILQKFCYKEQTDSSRT